MGITYAGEDSVANFCHLTKGHSLVRGSQKADATVDGSIYCEIKEARGGTANQVRPCSGNVLAIHAPNVYPGKSWLVMSPLDVLKDSENRRGQHTAIAFLCYSIQVRTKKYERFFCSDAELLETVREKSRDQNRRLLKICQEAKDAIEEDYDVINTRTKRRIRILMEDLDVGEH